MRISTVREFRNKATGLLPEITLPIELKRELYDMLSSDVAQQLKRRRVSEGGVLKDLEASRNKRRAARRRR